MTTTNHNGFSPRDTEQFYLSTLGRIEGKLDDLIKTSASAERVDRVESRVRDLETMGAKRTILDRIAWTAVGLVASGNLIFQGVSAL